MTAGVYVFNQYYCDLLKKLKQCAKKIKDRSAVAKQTMASIKKHYATFDKMSNDHLDYVLENIPDAFWAELIKDNKQDQNEPKELEPEPDQEDQDEQNNDPVSSLKEWAKQNPDVYLFQDISIISVLKIVKEDAVIYQYMLTLSIFKDPELTDEDVKNIVEKLKGIDDDIKTPDRHEKTIKMIMNSHMKNTGGFTMDDIKGTQIGNLANDIMNDLDLDKIKENVKKEGDVFKALSNSENGIGNILGSVSQKMASKISSGELKQDKLIQEALGLAGKMPQFQGGGAGGAGSPDIANIMKMVGGMMGQGGGMPNMPNMGGMNMPSSRKVKRMMKKKS